MQPKKKKKKDIQTIHKWWLVHQIPSADPFQLESLVLFIFREHWFTQLYSLRGTGGFYQSEPTDIEEETHFTMAITLWAQV